MRLQRVEQIVRPGEDILLVMNRAGRSGPVIAGDADAADLLARNEAELRAADTGGRIGPSLGAAVGKTRGVEQGRREDVVLRQRGVLRPAEPEFFELRKLAGANLLGVVDGVAPEQ